MDLVRVDNRTFVCLYIGGPDKVHLCRGSECLEDKDDPGAYYCDEDCARLGAAEDRKEPSTMSKAM